MSHRIRRAAERVRARLAPTGSGQHRKPAHDVTTRGNTPGRTAPPRPCPRLGANLLAHLAEEVAV